MKRNRESKQVEEALIFVTVIALIALAFLSLDKIQQSSFSEITGEVVTTVNITQMMINYCNFTLYEGLNLVSFFCISNTANRENVISNITNLVAIFEYQEGEVDAWKTYNPSLPPSIVQDLNYLSRTEGYWVDMESQEQYLLEGGLRIPTSILLTTGWNLAGYPTNKSESVLTSFETISGNYTEVRAYNAIADVFISYIPGFGGALTSTDPYFGYWINVATADTWVVD